MTRKFIALVVAILFQASSFLAACGRQGPEPTIIPPGGQDWTNGLGQYACEQMGDKDTDGDGICDKVEAQDVTFGPECVDNPNCKNDGGQTERDHPWNWTSFTIGAASIVVLGAAIKYRHNIVKFTKKTIGKITGKSDQPKPTTITPEELIQFPETTYYEDYKLDVSLSPSKDSKMIVWAQVIFSEPIRVLGESQGVIGIVCINSLIVEHQAHKFYADNKLEGQVQFQIPGVKIVDPLLSKLLSVAEFRTECYEEPGAYLAIQSGTTKNKYSWTKINPLVIGFSKSNVQDLLVTPATKIKFENITEANPTFMSSDPDHPDEQSPVYKLTNTSSYPLKDVNKCLDPMNQGCAMRVLLGIPDQQVSVSEVLDKTYTIP